MNICKQPANREKDRPVLVESLESRALLPITHSLVETRSASLHGQFFEATPTETTPTADLAISSSFGSDFTRTLSATGLRITYVSGSVGDAVVSRDIETAQKGLRGGTLQLNGALGTFFDPTQPPERR